MLAGQVAIVTGAGRGIGRSIAIRLAKQGARVALASRNQGELNRTRELIETTGGEALAIATDVAHDRDVDVLVSQTIERFERADILVNNAGVAPSGTVESMDPATFDALVAVNIRSVYLCCRAVWPQMRKMGGGTIVNISSVAALEPFAGLGAYGATKAFVNLYTKALADEGGPLGIRVFGIAPGAVDTKMLRELYPDFPTDQMLAPDAIAAAVEQLLLPGAIAVPGQTIVVRKDA